MKGEVAGGGGTVAPASTERRLCISSVLSAYRFPAVLDRRGNRGSPCPATLVFPWRLTCAVPPAVMASHAVPSVLSPLPPSGCQTLKQNKTNKKTKAGDAATFEYRTNSEKNLCAIGTYLS